jgi:hypothetical protein
VESCDHKNITVLEKLGHSYVGVVTAPTYEDRGFTTYTCSVCDDRYVGDFVDTLVREGRVRSRSRQRTAPNNETVEFADEQTPLSDAVEAELEELTDELTDEILEEMILETTGELNGIVLTATVTQIGVLFNWTPSDNPLGYRLYRALEPGDEGISISNSPIAGSIFFDANVEPDTWYYYTIAEVIAEEEDGQDEATGARSEELAIIMTSVEADLEAGRRGFIMMTIGDPWMLVNDEKVEIDPGRGTTPIIQGGRTMLPIRAVVESIDGSVDWDEEARSVTLRHNENSVHMWLGRRDFLAGDVTDTMDVEPYIRNDRIMLPVRFVAESLGCQLEWFGSLNMVVIVFAMPEEEMDETVD